MYLRSHQIGVCATYRKMKKKMALTWYEGILRCLERDGKKAYTHKNAVHKTSSTVCAHVWQYREGQSGYDYTSISEKYQVTQHKTYKSMRKGEQ